MRATELCNRDGPRNSLNALPCWLSVAALNSSTHFTYLLGMHSSYRTCVASSACGYAELCCLAQVDIRLLCILQKASTS